MRVDPAKRQEQGHSVSPQDAPLQKHDKKVPTSFGEANMEDLAGRDLTILSKEENVTSAFQRVFGE